MNGSLVLPSLITPELLMGIENIIEDNTPEYGQIRDRIIRKWIPTTTNSYSKRRNMGLDATDSQLKCGLYQRLPQSLQQDVWSSVYKDSVTFEKLCQRIRKAATILNTENKANTDEPPMSVCIRGEK